MTPSQDDPNTTDAASDPLLQRYREANALDDGRPATGLREAVLAQARAQATKATSDAPFKPPPTSAANDRTWTLRALGTLAALGLVGLLVMQFDQGTPEEREVAFGSPPSASTPSASRSSAPSPAPAPADIATEPATVEAPPVLQAPAAESRAESPQRRPAPATRLKPESACELPPQASSAAPPPKEAPAPQPDRRASEPGADLSPPESAAAHSRAAAPPVAIQAPVPAASGEASRPALQRAPESLSLPALLRAAQVGDLASAREAIGRGDDLNTADVNGRTALMTAAARGDLALVRLLLDAGADTARTDQKGLTAADLARQAGHDSVVNLL
ncbi:ankyrin repeat domain-containing protein [Hydrogenophaga sp.]|uniref:ankyrin repeat domain-containing protein n=1 Tax=Hydrogenophaga sp. TaxID=1904254 RepID=UPI0027195542|nr:ankyrin repeat domain-containing protein [Hydrogenophaga sp.]MDO8903494.1 ankyrin repeat domain-containing protein [Hydrogenophaga sp.]